VDRGFSVKLGVVGTGLIGGSFALGARTRNLFQQFVGIDPDLSAGEQAVALGIVDETAAEVPADCDAVILAGPSDTIADWVVALAEHPAIVFDVGSIKGGVIDGVQAQLGQLPPRFVPCHPIAGRERSGPAAADEDLFADRLVIQTPHPTTSQAALDQVVFWWRSLGARTQIMRAADHDEVYALTSHLPHLLAFAYLQQVEEQHLQHAGGGFRDFSRIGGSDPDMWTAIFELNKRALLPAIDGFVEALGQLRRAVESGDKAEIHRLLTKAQRNRAGYDGD
jgi:prephenate dehydrogenase